MNRLLKVAPTTLTMLTILALGLLAAPAAHAGLVCPSWEANATLEPTKAGAAMGLGGIAGVRANHDCTELFGALVTGYVKDYPTLTVTIVTKEQGDLIVGSILMYQGVGTLVMTTSGPVSEAFPVDKVVGIRIYSGNPPHGKLTLLLEATL